MNSKVLCFSSIKHYSTKTCLARLEDGSGFAVLPGRFQRHVAFSVSVKHSEEVVVGARHDDTDDKIKEGEVAERT